MAKKSRRRPPDSFMKLARQALKKIPKGKVATYGQVATMAGNPKAARQVVRLLHSSSEKEKLPWHRVINSKGGISLTRGRGYELQKAMLMAEGIRFKANDLVDLSVYGWRPATRKPLTV